MKIKISILLMSMMLMFSCIQETIVVNVVHEDGSVMRKVTIKSDKQNIDPNGYRVPIDSTWHIEYSYDIGEKNDTTWILTAEKLFVSAEKISEAYKNDQGSNQSMKRSAKFSKSFKWFSRVFRYSERIESTLSIDCPLSDYFSEEELKQLSIPKNILEEMKNGPDSLRIKALSDSIETNSEKYIVTVFVRQWIEVFCAEADKNPELNLDSEKFRARESEFILDLENLADDFDFKVDSFILYELGQEFVNTYKTEIDSSNSILEEMAESFLNTNDYNLGIVMPGKIIATNGYAKTDSDSDIGVAVLWTVDGFLFLTQDYEMWTESRMNIYWTWVLTALFILFVFTGFIIRFKKKK